MVYYMILYDLYISLYNLNYYYYYYFSFFFFEKERWNFIEPNLPNWSNHFELQKVKDRELSPSMLHSQKHLSSI